jgi:O-antigen/teichoic acid export membrane protein
MVASHPAADEPTRAGEAVTTPIDCPIPAPRRPRGLPRALSGETPPTHGTQTGAAEPGAPAHGTPGDSITHNVGSYLALQIISFSFTAVLTLFLVRALNPVGYGLLALGIAIGGVALLLADFGVSQSSARFIAENREDRTTVAQLITSALRIKLSLGGFIGVSLFVGAGLVADAYGTPGLTLVLRAISIVVLAQSLMTFLSYSLVALGRTALNLRIVLAQSLVETVASIALVLLGAGAAGAAAGKAGSYVVGTAVALAVMTRLLGRGAISLRARTRSWERRILRYGAALVVVDSAYMLFAQIDVLLIGALLNPTAVGLYTAPVRLLPLVQVPAMALSAGVSPRMARGRGQASTATFVITLRYLGILQAALIAPLLVWATPIVHILFGPGYAGSADVLRAMTPFAFLLGFGTILSMTANYLGRARLRIAVAIMTVAINFVVDIVLIPRIGIVGGAIGTDLGYTLYAPAHLWICKQSLDFSVMPILRTLARALVASCVMALVLLAFGTEPSALGLVAGSLAGVVAFMGTLVAAGALSTSEIRMAANTAARAIPRRAGG